MQVTELRRLGVLAEELPTGLRIQGNPSLRRPSQARIPPLVRCYDDHRMAMSLSVLGSVTFGVVLDQPLCVGKTFPEFWDFLAALPALGFAMEVSGFQPPQLFSQSQDLRGAADKAEGGSGGLASEADAIKSVDSGLTSEGAEAPVATSSVTSPEATGEAQVAEARRLLLASEAAHKSATPQASTSPPPRRDGLTSIVIVGMRGAGKSWLGRTAAAALGWNWIDMDDEMEKSQGMR